METKTTYREDQEVDILSEIIVTAAMDAAMEKQKKSEAIIKAARSMIESIITNCFKLDQAETQPLIDRASAAAKGKLGKRMLEAETCTDIDLK